MDRILYGPVSYNIRLSIVSVEKYQFYAVLIDFLSVVLSSKMDSIANPSDNQAPRLVIGQHRRRVSSGYLYFSFHRMQPAPATKVSDETWRNLSAAQTT